jgi:hypothetical protein
MRPARAAALKADRPNIVCANDITIAHGQVQTRVFAAGSEVLFPAHFASGAECNRTRAGAVNSLFG